MRILALLLILLLAACTPAGDTAAPQAATAASPDASAEPDPMRNGRSGAWERAESERKMLPIVWEYRSDLEPARRAAFKQLLVVSMFTDTVQSARSRHTAQQVRAFDAIEHELGAALAGKAELVAVLDYYRQYDWYFYTNDADAAAIQAIVEKSAEKDISVKVEEDAEGKFYTALLGRLHATE